jgi:hypothetical protein
MLKDPKIRGFGSEFLSCWLKSRNFEQWSGVDRGYFKAAYDDELQKAMFEEPIRYMIDLCRNDGSFFELLYGKHVVVNERLARHYKLPFEPAGPDWQRLSATENSGRGGILGMGVFMTMHAAGQRSSPVKRGHWLVTCVLGEHIPPPPADVPQLPSSEKDLSTTTLRQMLEVHRKHPNCAGCHQRFDGYGLLFEGYGPIGERRDKDLAGRPIDSVVVFPEGKLDGVAALREHLLRFRHQDFVKQLSFSLMAYAVGRELELLDDPLLVQIQKILNEKNGNICAALETIVCSRQFTHRRTGRTENGATSP